MTEQAPPAPGGGADEQPRPPLPAALRRRLVISSAAVVVLAAVVVVALVSASRFSHQLNATGASASSPAGMATIQSPGFVRLAARSPVPFSLPELSDPATKVSLASLRGKPLILNFWSSSCTVCATEAPAMAAAYRRLGTALRFVGIDTDETSRSAGIAFARRYGLDYPMLYDGSMAVAGKYTAALPVTYFVSARGKIVGENLGALTVASLRSDARKAFSAPPG